MIKPSGVLQRVNPLCPVFRECGGCSFQDMVYADELELKENHLKDLLNGNLSVDDQVFERITASPQSYHYRHRLDLKIVRNRGQEISMGFSSEASKRLIPLDTCYIAREEIAGIFSKLKTEAEGRIKPKHRQANLVVRTDDSGRVFWGGIGRRSLQLQESDYLWTELNGRKIFYSLDTFFQANLSILPKLFERLYQFPFWTKDTIFYDLYGGVGLFSIGLIDRIFKAYLIEECQASIKLARFNAAFHRLSNIEILEGKVEHCLPKLLKETDHPGCQVALVDPPRAGLSQEALKVIASAKQLNFLLYLSCHPESLLRDLTYLTQHQWQVQKIMPFDFFPKTKHMETLVLLTQDENGK